MPMTVKKKDIITGYDIDIKITSKSDQAAQMEKDRVSLMAVAPLSLQDPRIPLISKDMLRRRLYRANGLSSEEAMLYVPPSMEEIRAMDDVELINRDILPELPQPNEDLMTYLVVYQRAIPTKAKWQSIEAVKRMYSLTGQGAQAQLNQ